LQAAKEIEGVAVRDERGVSALAAGQRRTRLPLRVIEFQQPVTLLATGHVEFPTENGARGGLDCLGKFWKLLPTRRRIAQPQDFARGVRAVRPASNVEAARVARVSEIAARAGKRR